MTQYVLGALAGVVLAAVGILAFFIWSNRGS